MQLHVLNHTSFPFAYYFTRIGTNQDHAKFGNHNAQEMMHLLWFVKGRINEIVMKSGGMLPA
jgi:hypothetical protein